METTFDMGGIPRTLELKRDERGVLLEYIDQRKLPDELVFVEARDWMQVVDAIKTLAVRGAPAIGVAGAAALAVYAGNGGTREGFDGMAERVAEARPTAVNLRWAVDRARRHVEGAEWADVPEMLYALVIEMEEEDERTNRTMGAWGAELLGSGARVLTHCNAGSLATCYYGTALGVVYRAAELGKVARVFADETRPVGQGARLTVWELSRAGIPTTLICDNMAAALMAKGEVDAVIVGADRIARNGDFANKIGTYGLAVNAREHGIPFYVAAPVSTIDASTASGDEIVIEQRDASEVLPRPIEGVDVWNPAFDVTPARFVTKFITEKGVHDPDDLPVG